MIIIIFETMIPAILIQILFIPHRSFPPAVTCNILALSAFTIIKWERKKEKT